MVLLRNPWLSQYLYEPRGIYGFLVSSCLPTEFQGVKTWSCLKFDSCLELNDTFVLTADEELFVNNISYTKTYVHVITDLVGLHIFIIL